MADSKDQTNVIMSLLASQTSASEGSVNINRVVNYRFFLPAVAGDNPVAGGHFVQNDGL
ncbi:MAG: hypothetical protein IH947_00475 [Bacteroidetes bacterium]|nr:hypothetical protein [Bacteroidota bacterium]MCH8233873.1 hypothetical protein [Bacteroidota bacterium]